MKRHATFMDVRASAYAYTDHYVEKLMKRTKKNIISNSMETALVWELGPVVDRILQFVPDEDIENWLSGFTSKDLCDDMWDTIVQYAIEPEDDGSYALFQCDPPGANAEWLMGRILGWMRENGKWRKVAYELEIKYLGKGWMLDDGLIARRAFPSLKKAKAWMMDDVQDAISRWPELGEPVKSRSGLIAGEGEYKIRWTIRRVKA